MIATLPKLSAARARYQAIRRGMSQYWLDMLVEEMQRRNPVGTVYGQVGALLRDPLAETELYIPGLNIVTNDGDTYYAQSAAGESPDDDFDGANSGLRLGDDNTAVTKTDTDVTNFLSGSALDLDAGYDKTDDDDANNTGSGADILTWRYSYLTSEGNVSDIIEGAIVDNRTTPTAALSHFLFAATFSKTSNDTLVVYVNHTFNGT